MMSFPSLTSCYYICSRGWNFESTLLAETLKAFGVKKTHTTAYHLQGDGMVEWFNRSLLQLLRTYVDKQEDL